MNLHFVSSQKRFFLLNTGCMFLRVVNVLNLKIPFEQTTLQAFFGRLLTLIAFDPELGVNCAGVCSPQAKTV